MAASHHPKTLLFGLVLLSSLVFCATIFGQATQNRPESEGPNTYFLWGDHLHRLSNSGRMSRVSLGKIDAGRIKDLGIGSHSPTSVPMPAAFAKDALIVAQSPTPYQYCQYSASKIPLKTLDADFTNGQSAPTFETSSEATAKWLDTESPLAKGSLGLIESMRRMGVTGPMPASGKGFSLVLVHGAAVPTAYLRVKAGLFKYTFVSPGTWTESELANPPSQLPLVAAITSPDGDYLVTSANELLLVSKEKDGGPSACTLVKKLEPADTVGAWVVQRDGDVVSLYWFVEESGRWTLKAKIAGADLPPDRAAAVAKAKSDLDGHFERVEKLKLPYFMLYF